jgi:succinate-semialdehyde dehydrogenase/glutarate-semialdehyde dehydrogenase
MSIVHKCHYINGKWEDNKKDKMNITNPANGEIIGTVPNGGQKETTAAIEAAYEALSDWSKLTANERADYLKKVYQLMLDNEEELARLMTLEMGKPLHESKAEVQYAASFLEWYAEEGKRIYGRTVPGKTANQRIQVQHKPVGVVAAITPWNFPAAMITRKMGPALAAGCTFVVKPPEEAPLTAVKLMEYCEQAGLPEGVVNLVTGDPAEIGEAFMNHIKVRKITFTGSTEVGKMLIEQSAKHVKNLSLELGGHAPFIIIDDADIEKAVDGVIASKFRNSGQTCICANRVYVQSGIYDQFIEVLTKAVKKLKVGDGLEEGVHIGPIIDKDGFDKIDRQVKEAKEKGAEVVFGGKALDREGGYFYLPTILKNTTHDMQVMQEETFGPVIPIQKVESDQEAIELANDSPYGLASYLYTESVRRGTRIVEELDYGIVGWNDGAPSAAQAPFGGMKQSGIGREGGKEGIEAYLETKYVSLGL